MGVRQCQDQYKASNVGSVLSSEDLVSKISGESPKNCQVFQDLYSSIAQLDISNLSQKTIQHALDEKFYGLKENLACERESARLLSLSVRHAGAWLSAPPIPALGLHMAPNEFRISAKYRLGVPVYDAERCPFCKAGVLDIYGDHAIACHGREDAIARHDRIRDKIVSACSSANLSPVVEKKNLIPESHSRPGDIFVPTWKAGQPAAFDVPLLRRCNPTLSLMRLQRQDTHLMQQMKENIVSTTITAQKWESHLFPLQLKSLAGYRQPSRKHSSGWLC